jgi:hypothetical protein
MSEADSERGRSGQGWASGVNYNDWKAGADERDRNMPTAFLPTGPTIGIAIIPLMLAAPLMYPIAGSATIAAMFATRWGLDLFAIRGGTGTLVSIGTGVAAFLIAIRVERALSRFALYRLARVALRFAIIVGIFVLIGAGSVGVYIPACLFGVILVWIAAKVDKKYDLGKPLVARSVSPA